MSAAVQRAVRELMEDAGFVLVREAKHLVWKRGQTMIVTSRAPSDYRALKNIQKQINQANQGKEVT